MIKATKLIYQNFFSTGNAPITVALDSHQSTLVVGRNGAGKSTMTEAICFAWFGRALRNVNKPTVVNSINGRDCLVELHFETNSGNYIVKRGLKPTVFEIYHNGQLIPPPADAKDYQTMLEESILKLTYKTFMQVVVLGSASYTPFMQLTTAARRGIIEDLLDIEVFSEMSALAKDDLSKLKVDIDKCMTTRNLLNEQLRMAQSFEAAIEQDQKDQLSKVHQAIATVTQEIADAEADYEDLQEDHAAMLPVKSQYDGIVTKRQELKAVLSKLNAKKDRIDKDHAFYDANDVCPTCTQSITNEFKDGIYRQLALDADKVAQAVTKAQGMDVVLTKNASALQVDLQTLSDLQTQMTRIKAQIPLLQRRMKELNTEATRILTPVQKPAPVDTGAIQTKLTDVTKDQTDLSKQKVVYDAATMLLKDNGIKTRVIKHYLPIINQSINVYLNALDFPIQFTFDDEFKEVMKSRHRDDFAYENFSEGEKKRIDLALLLTWRAVAKMKNSASVNLLILDEVFDSSLDASGIDEFLKILAGLEKDTHVFVISHRTDQMVDKFSHTLTFEKQKGFSCLK